METWGFFDDENTATLEYVKELESHILPKKYNIVFPKIESSIEDVNENMDKLRKQIGNDKMINVVTLPKTGGSRVVLEYETDDIIKINEKRKKYIMKNMDKVMDKMKNDILEKGLSEYIMSGVGMFLARDWKATPFLAKKHGTVDRGFGLNSKLPESFPQGLKKIAYHASLNQLKDFDNHEEWTNPSLRKKL